MASGEVKNVKKNEITGNSKVGSVVKVGGDDAIVIGSKGTIKDGSKSSYVDDLIKGIDDAKKSGKVGDEVFEKSKKAYDDLLDASKDSNGVIGKNIEAVVAKINKTGGVPRNPNFRINYFKHLENFGVKLSENAKKFIAIHHIVPNFLKGNQKIVDFLTNMGHNIDEVQNAIGLPRIDLQLLDDAIKSINVSHIDEIKTILKLGDDVDVKELNRIVKELEEFKTASIHAVDSYHPAFNTMMKTEIEKLMLQFEDLIESGISQSKALKCISQFLII